MGARETLPVPFYESDCQGQTSPFLMTQSFFSGQSALTSSPNSRSCAASIGVGQSSFSSLPCRLERLDGSELDEYQAFAVARREPRFYLRLGYGSRPDAFSGSARGPRVRRVPRHDCWPGETQGTRLPHAPASRILEPPARGTTPHRGPRGPGVNALASSSGSHQSALLSSTVAR